MHKNRKFQHAQNDGTSNSSAASPSQHQQVQGECALCKRISVCICQRCGDFYCSPECQRKDWQSHRYICFQMPPLIKAHSDSNPLATDPAIPVLSTPLLNSEKQDKQKQFNTSSHPNQSSADQTMRQRQQTQPNNAQKNSQVLVGNPPVSPLPANNSYVLLTGFRSPNRCYVRSLSSGENDGYMRSAKAIDAYGKTAPKLTKLPVANSYAITNMDGSGVMHRVQILSAAGKQNIRVLFSDYGNTAVRQLSDLREISEEILQLKQHAVQVSLKDVENYARTDKIIKFLSDFEDCEFKIFYNAEDERSRTVVLKSIQDKFVLNEKILEFAANMQIFDKNKNNVASDNVSKQNGFETVDKNQKSSNKENRQENRKGHTKPDVRHSDQETKTLAKQAPQDTQGPTIVAPFATRTLEKKAENIDVFVLDNSCLELGYFGCTPINDVKNMAKVQSYLENYKDTNEPYEPRLNEYCIAKFEDAWYRAKVISIPKKNRYTVLYVDYTNESDLGSKDIRKYPLDLTLDCTTSLCLIHGLPDDLTPEMVEILQAKIPVNKPIKISKVKDIEDQIVIVELPNVLKAL